MYGMQYTDEMRQFILENYKGIYSWELADRFNKKFGTQVTASQMRSYRNNHNLSCGLSGQFQKGLIPHNKGKRMPAEVYEKTKHTMFKKGHMPNNHRPVGSERVNRDGYIEIKLAEPKKWRLKHNVIYEQYHGAIPKGYIVVFLDGNKMNLDPGNLKLLSRGELLIMNRQGLFRESAELTEAAINVVKLINATSSAKKRKEN